MATIHETDRYPWRVREVILTAVLGLGGIAAMWFGIKDDTLALSGLLGPALLILFIFQIVRNIQIKSARVLHVEADDESGDFNVWMNKENRAMWNDKLNRKRNSGSLKDLRTIGYQEIGIYGVYTFTLKNGTVLYLPERGMKPKVAEFFRNWIRGQMNNTVNYKDKDSSVKFGQAIGLSESVKKS